MKSNIFNKYNFFKIITPLRVISLFCLIEIISFYIKNRDYEGELGLGGVLYLGLSFILLLSLLLDLFLSTFFKTKKNWIIQSIVTFILIISIFTL
jgi:hypothetical protein